MPAAAAGEIERTAERVTLVLRGDKWWARVVARTHNEPGDTVRLTVTDLKVCRGTKPISLRYGTVITLRQSAAANHGTVTF